VPPIPPPPQSPLPWRLSVTSKPMRLRRAGRCRLRRRRPVPIFRRRFCSGHGRPGHRRPVFLFWCSSWWPRRWVGTSGVCWPQRFMVAWAYMVLKQGSSVLCVVCGRCHEQAGRSPAAAAAARHSGQLGLGSLAGRSGHEAGAWRASGQRRGAPAAATAGPGVSSERWSLPGSYWSGCCVS
jgi:hypothetical protein